MALAAALLVAILVVLLNDDAESDSADRAARASTLDELLEDASRFYDERVTLAAPVREVTGPRSFVVGGTPYFSGDELLVVADSDTPAPSSAALGRPLLENDLVQVTGTLRPFDFERFGRAAGTDLTRSLRSRQGQPALLAEEIDVTPRLVPVRDVTSSGELARAPQRYLGTLVSIDGEVTATPAERAVVLDDRLLVLTGEGRGAPQRGERVQVTGIVRRFDPDQLSALGVPELDEDLYGDFADRPVLVADSISVTGSNGRP